MQAHSAPLGLLFYQGEMFPPDYRGSLFVTFHGSWNRSVPTGYKVVRIKFNDKGEPQGPPEDFISGWIRPRETKKGKWMGRPVGLVIWPGWRVIRQRRFRRGSVSRDLEPTVNT